MKKIMAIGLSTFLLFISTNSCTAQSSEKPPIRASEIKIELGAFKPCLNLVPEDVEYLPAADMLMIHVKVTLKKSAASCVRGIGYPSIVAHDSAGNELLREVVKLPEDVGTSNRRKLLAHPIPSDLKPPITLKVR